MPVTVVVGAQWGDEGKAKVIDLLAKEHPVVARYQGGHNAGHTVVVGDENTRCNSRHQACYDTVTPVIANGVVVDLPTLFNEIDMLTARESTATSCRCRHEPISSSRGIRVMMRSPRKAAAITRLEQP